MLRVRRRPLRLTADIAVSVLVAYYLTVVVLLESEGQPWALTALGLAAAAGQAVALWWRRTRPVPVMAVALAGGTFTHVIAPEGVFPVAALVAVVPLTLAYPPRFSLYGLAALLALTSMNFWTTTTGDAQFAMVIPVLVWTLTETVRSRRAAIAEASRRAVGEEQARIARELHDVIAHSVSVIVVQAAAADDVFDEAPEQARASLRSIESTGRSALGELRRLLAATRPGGEDESRRPQPALDRLGELAEPLRAAGLHVAVHREDTTDGPPVPAGVELSAYRIVQEALTNTLRHAEGAGRVEVTVRTAAGMLEIDVLDDGGGSAADTEGGGFGITGMRERASMLGGSLDAGPCSGGGFRVQARLPLEVTG
ncbi:sensor histidine kinase [Streptomyces armeniacus]|uniref:histidine kinase n=1 Tax=Streptomyces armeniacus TaxID=83291 RepID=A0A345XN06_9ACTN|nr:sensor histidine kinase [Streptomyces armeniacus]AXK33022.1 sensor histidine kinase [Streptomyces armeniacus]